MNIVERELTITYNNVKSVSASDKVTLGVAATAFAPAVAYRIYTSHAKGEYYAYLTQGGLDLLFPSDTAKPFKADAGVVTASRFAGSTSNNNQMWAYLNGTTTTALNVTTSDQDKIDYGITSGVAGIDVSSVSISFSTAVFLSWNLSYLASETNPTDLPISVNLKSALSCLKINLYSALEVIILYGSLVPFVTISSIKTPIYP